MPSLTVIHPNYNHADVLPRAIRAIATQSRPPEQYIIVDDGSTDQSRDVIAQHARQFPFIQAILLEQNQGVVAAANAGLRRAAGDYIYGAASDDYVMPGFFASALRVAEMYPQAGIIFGKMAYSSAQDRRLCVTGVKRWSGSFYAPPQQFLQDVSLAEPPDFTLTSSTIFRRDALLEIGGWRPEAESLCDFFATHALALKYGAYYLDQVCANLTHSPAGYSGGVWQDPQRVHRIADRVAELMRSAEFRSRFPEQFASSWEASIRMLIPGEMEKRRSIVVPRDLRHVRQAYLELSRHGGPIDRALGLLLRTILRLTGQLPR